MVQTESYFEFTRKEITSLLPSAADRILEIGCGRGNTLAWLKTRYPNAETVGVEYWEGAKAELSANADLAIMADLESGLPAELTGTFDLILVLDVFEHLSHPGRMLELLASRLTPGGRFIVSLPNIAHLSVSLPLLFKREFAFTDAGIMDRTHLRWFTEATALGLMNSAGLTVSDGIVNGLDGPKARLLDILTLGRLRHWLSKQYIMLGQPGSSQAPVKWRIPSERAVNAKVGPSPKRDGASRVSPDTARG